MRLLRKTANLLQKKGVLATVRYTFRKCLGINKRQEEIDTVFYFLNKYFNISDMPPAEGRLRDLQLCDVQLLRIFDAVCRRQGWTYWLDYGTMLGSVRHRGFIPWDDDLDVAMPRSDYEKAQKELPKLLEPYGIPIIVQQNDPAMMMGIGYRHEETGIWMDVFPVDMCDRAQTNHEERNKLQKDILRYRRKYYRMSHRKNQAKLNDLRNKMIPSDETVETVTYYHGPEFIYSRLIYHDKQAIFPLSRGMFEGYEFNVPADHKTYLAAFYGRNFMEFPKSGVEHHGRDGLRLSDWAYQHGVDMSEIQKTLSEIANQMQQQKEAQS